MIRPTTKQLTEKGQKCWKWQEVSLTLLDFKTLSVFLLKLEEMYKQYRSVPSCVQRGENEGRRRARETEATLTCELCYGKNGSTSLQVWLTFLDAIPVLLQAVYVDPVTVCKGWTEVQRVSFWSFQPYSRWESCVWDRHTSASLPVRSAGWPKGQRCSYKLFP